MTRLLLMRHGETEWNAAQRIQGHRDSPLNARGQAQAGRLAERLRSLPLDAVYSSDLSRARDTAAPLARARDLPLRILPQLREKNYGDWEGLTAAELETAFPDAWRRYHVLREWDYPVPGGETWAQVQARLRLVLERVLADHPDQTVAMVGHGGSLRTLILDALQAPLPSLRHLSLDNASLSRLDYQDPHNGRVVFLNDTTHLGDEPE